MSQWQVLLKSLETNPIKAPPAKMDRMSACKARHLMQEIKLIEVLTNHRGLTARQISAQVDVSIDRARKMTNDMELSGVLERYVGSANQFYWRLTK